MVVCHHYVASQADNGSNVSHWLLNFGGAGVDIFFVISGFIMMITQSDPTRSYSAKEFLLRRLARIAPLYWALTALAFAMVLIAGNAINSQISTQEFFMSMLFLPYSETDISMSVSAHTAYVIPMAWTLTFEWYFYAVFAISLALGLRPLARLPFIALWFFLAVVAGFIFQPSMLILQMMMNPIVFEFLFGCVIAILYMRGCRLSGTQAFLLATGSLLVLSNLMHAYPLTRTLIWGSAAFALIAAATLYEDRQEKAMAIRPFAHLGDISYSLYLSHFFSLALFTRLQQRFDFLGEGFDPLTIIVFIILAWLVAKAFYRVIEQPARGFFKWRQTRLVKPTLVTESNGKRAI
jgi:peptidoglycan/LPS O-acetylase OafA/YrhL